MQDAGWAALPSDELVAHSEFVRRLARSLLRDVHLADDVAQDSLMAALTHPAPRRAPVRAWLAGIVRNRVRMEVRGDARRARREHAAAGSARVPTPDELVARLEVGKRLVDAVLSLDEPYRSATFLRFFEDLTPTEIARRTGVPVDTVKTRLRRALGMLRERLDRDHAGGRAAWCAALVPVLRLPPGLPGPALTGGIVMAAKSKAAIVVAALLGILAGAAGRDVLVGTGEDGRGPPEQDTAVEPRSASTAANAPTARPSARPAIDAPATPTADKLVLDLAMRPAPAGEGHVRGRVRTAEGDPVEGVVVTASRPADPGFSFPGIDASRDLKEWARASVQEEMRRRARQRTATTAADGSYDVAGLADVPWQLTASHPAFDVEAAGPSDGRWVRAGESVDFTAVPVARVQVDVLGPGDSVVDEAMLAVRDAAGGDPQRRPWTPEEPILRLRRGSWSVEAFANNGELSAPAVNVEVSSPSDSPRIVLRLSERLGVRGRVLHPPADSLRALFVHLLRLPDGVSGPDALPRLVRDGQRATTFEILDFRFRFDGVEPGRYLLGVSNMASAVLVSREVAVETKSVWQDLDVPAPDDASFVTVSVTGADGSSLADADVQLAIGDWVPFGGMPSADVVRGTDGTFRVRRSSEDRVRDDPLRLVVRSKSLGRRDVPFDPAATAPVEVRFGAPAGLAVTVTGAGALPRGRLSLFLRPAREGGSAPSVGPGDGERRAVEAGGRAEFSPLQPGDYDLVTTIEDESGAEIRRIATERVTVRSGANQVTATVPALESLSVEVAGAAAGATVQLAAMPGGPPVQRVSQSTDSTGRAVFDLLPPGRYHLTCTVEGRLCVATADVPAQRLVQLHPVTRDR